MEMTVTGNEVQNLTSAMNPTGAPQPDEGFNGPQGNTFASGIARLAAPPVPLRPAGTDDPGQAPNIGANPAPGSFSQRFAAALNAPSNGKPLSFSAAAVRAATHAMAKTPSVLDAALGNLGDAAAASGPVPSGGGALTGITRTLAAGQQREAQQKQQQFENDEKASALEMEQQKTKAVIAESNARMIHEQALTHQLGEDAVNASITNGKQAVTKFTSAHVPATVLQDGVTSAQMQTLIANKQLDPTTSTAFPTGRKQVGEDANGQPQYATTYSVLSMPGDVKVSEEDAPFLSKYSGLDVKPGQVLPGAQYNNLFQTASDNQAATAARNKTLGDNEIAAGEQAQKLESVRLGPEWTNALSAAKNDPVKALGAMLANPAIKQQYPHLAQDVMQSYGGAKEWETIRHNQQEESIKRAELAQKNAGNAAGASGLQGDEYIKTLAPTDAATVKAIGEGRMQLPSRATKEGLRVAGLVNSAYPDWDQSKGTTWNKSRNEYMGSGKTATQIVPAYNTALAHMQDLYTNTTPEGIFNPTSKAYQDRQVALGYVAREVGKAVSAGAMTQKESEELLSDLKGGLTPALKRERILKTAQLLHDKIDEYQTKFEAAAPSSAIAVPTLISPKAAQSYDFIQSGGQTQSAQPTQQPVGHQVGDTIIQNGRTFTVTSVDQNGKVTGAK
jgi:hypothetical protein